MDKFTLATLKSKTKKWVSMVLSTFIYLCILPFGFEVIDPCASTPGHNFTLGYALTIFFPIFLGFIFYVLFLHKKNFNYKVCAKSIFMSVICLSVSLLVTLLIMSLIFSIEPHIIGTSFFSWFFEYGCYNDIELKTYVPIILYTINITLFNYILYLYINRKIIKLK